MKPCPRCEDEGRSIDPETLQAQVVSQRLDQNDDYENWRLCLSETCEVVYFRGDAFVGLAQVRAVPFHKSEDPSRLVCFCFGHTVAEIQADFADGESAIRASIKAACAAGRDDCERKNPQGRCCLGNVGKVLKQSASSCCGSSESNHNVPDSGLC